MSAGGTSSCALPSFVQSVQGSPERDIPDDMLKTPQTTTSMGRILLHETVWMDQLSTSQGQQYACPAIESTVESCVDVSHCVGGVAIHVPVAQGKDTACSIYRGCDDSSADDLSIEVGLLET